MAYSALTFSVGQVLTAAQMTNLQANFPAVMAGDSGAPRLVNAGVDAAAAIATSKIASDAGIAQGYLKTTTGQVSTASTTSVRLTLPGGSYGFYPRTRQGTVGTGAEVTAHIHQSNGLGGSTSFLTIISMQCEGAPTGYAEQRYVQASPPYDLGDGEIPLFIFVEVDINGDVVSAYEAPEAPWHYNGPTNIKADLYIKGKSYKIIKDLDEIEVSLKAAGYSAGMTLDSSKQLSMTAYADYFAAFQSAKDIPVELTQVIKNADMTLIPRPMEPAAGNTVVMLDPMADLTIKLAELKKYDEFSLLELLHDGDLVVSNTKLARAGPPGVDIMGYAFR